jgi:hypothetical protein
MAMKMQKTKPYYNSGQRIFENVGKLNTWSEGKKPDLHAKGVYMILNAHIYCCHSKCVCPHTY